MQLDGREIDYLFLAVSTCGTLAGISLKITEQLLNCKIIAVDIAGTQILGQSTRKKHISGIGTGFVPNNLIHAWFDDYMIIEKADVILECNNLLARGIDTDYSSNSEGKR